MQEKPLAAAIHAATHNVAVGPMLSVNRQQPTRPRSQRKLNKPRADLQVRGSPVTEPKHPPALPRPKVRPELASIKQTVLAHRALTDGQLRQWIKRADSGDPVFALLRLAIVRIGHSVFLSVPHFESFLESHRCLPPAPPRGRGRPAKKRQPEPATT